MQLIHDSLDRGFNFFDFSIQFPDEADGMLQFKRLSGHPGANGAFGGIPDFHRHVPPIAASGGVSQQSFQPGQVGGGNLLGPRKLRQQRIDRRHMKR